MDCGASGYAFFLPDEKFDFDVPPSPCSTTDEDEDEVFVGPVGHKERCISSTVVPPVSPLTGDQLQEMCQEAHKLADQLQSNKLPNSDANMEDFIQDSKAKLGILDPAARVLSPVKRETFCVQDSPMKQLPPAIQRQILRGGSTRAARTSSTAASSSRLSASAFSSSRLSASASSSSRLSASASSSSRLSASASSSSRLSASASSSSRLSASASSSSRLSASASSSSRLSASASSSSHLSASRVSPRDGAKAPARPALRGKAVLPNKLPTLPGSSSASKSRTEGTRLQPPRKVACGLKRSPSSRRSTRSQSCDDLLSDTASVTSDLSDSSVSSCTSGKRVLAPPTKTVGVRSVSGGKAPPLQNRRNTSSSSSSVSSFNSSTSLSPATGKVCSLSSSTGPAPGSVCRAASQSRARRSTAEPLRPAGRRSLSTHSRPPEAECVKAVRRSTLKRANSTPTQPTPNKRAMERPASSRLQGPLKATALPTPGRAAAHAADVSSVPKSKRLLSLSSMDRLPHKPSAGPLTPSAGGCTSLQMKARRPSGLPTPVRRRASAIPSPRSINPARTAPPAAVSDSDLDSARKESSFSPTPKPVQEEEPADIPDIQPFCLDEDEEEVKEPPSPPTSRPQQPEQTERPDVNEPSQEESEPDCDLMEVQTPGESNSKVEEVLLLDLPAPTPQPQEKLLIDLTNTPDLIRTTSKTTSAAQLIDLSSPLIRWSPEEKSENTAPLINLSF